jgi:hypothetical protein
MQQLKCKECKRQQFLSEAGSLKARKLTGRARFYEKQASVMEQKITEATRLSLLHPCSTEHRLTMLQLRREKSQASRVEIYAKEQKLRNARRLLEGAMSALAEAMLKSDSEDAVARLEAKVRHYKILVSQRQRRLGERKHGA